ncbi:NERD domain-containing protein [Bradyrhizobium stylosanthis]|uniref:NERD domain-containing protein n=1 Tax=Bradyrhizobium stylosanthis TaxID=1803665 RepID=UPI0009ED5488|nr:NERD domain-containing protein/DEAD/DEAH box helicase [Bradyrhizobium stylosanthis]
MAQYFGLGSDVPIEDSERLVADSLRQLPDDYVVLHHVAWQSRRNGREGDGEADFLVIHPRKGIVVIEVKGGGIDVVNGRWFSKDRYGQNHEIKNPYEQAIASKHALIGWLKGDLAISNVGIGHAVAFPHIDAVPPLGLVASKAITWSRADLAEPRKVIEGVISHWGLQANLSAQDTSRLLKLLAPTVTVRRTLVSISASSSNELFALTAQQVEALAGLRSVRGGLLFGGAGTGKTVLAIARAQQLSNEGFRTLLVCYNELLGDRLHAQFNDMKSLYATTFHKLCFQEARKAGLTIPSSPSVEWWETEAAELLVEACATNGAEFDAIVVDEAQDFAPSWLDALRCLFGSKAEQPFYVFADPRQELWGRNWANGADWPFTHQLTKNLRNTSPIAERICAVFQSNDHPSGINGPAPMWRDLENPKNPEIDVIAVVEKLIDEGFGPKNLLVLCGTAKTASRLRSFTVGPYSFGLWGGNGIAAETIARFKGLESEAVVLLLDRSDEVSIEKMLAYVGISRARAVLAVIGSGKQRNLLNWSYSAAVKSK